MSAAGVPAASEAAKAACVVGAAATVTLSASRVQHDAIGVTALYDWLAGGVAGCVAKTATAPIERVKLLLQTQGANTRVLSGEVRRFNGIGNTFSRVIAEQGVHTLWRGNVANCIRFFPTQAFNFAFKDAIKRRFPKLPGKSRRILWRNMAGNMAAGGVAGAGSLVLVYPLDFARTRLAADTGRDGVNREFRGLGDCLRKTMRAGGKNAVYEGFCTSLVLFTVYRGLYFGLYDTAKDELQWEHAAAKWSIAATTTAFSSTVVYPLDTVRRRIMMQAGKSSDRIHHQERWFPERRRGSKFWLATGEIWKADGVQGFFKGGLSNVFRGMGGAIVLVVYDEMKKSYS